MPSSAETMQFDQYESETGEFGSEWEPTVPEQDAETHESPYMDQAPYTAHDPVQADLLDFKGGYPEDWRLEGSGEGYTFDGEAVRHNETGEEWPGFSEFTLEQLRTSDMVRLDDVEIEGKIVVTYLRKGPDNSIRYEMHATDIRDESDVERDVFDQFEPIALVATNPEEEADVASPPVLRTFETVEMTASAFADAGNEISEVSDAQDQEHFEETTAEHIAVSPIEAPLPAIGASTEQSHLVLEQYLPIYRFEEDEPALEANPIRAETTAPTLVARPDAEPVPLATIEEISEAVQEERAMETPVVEPEVRADADVESPISEEKTANEPAKKSVETSSITPQRTELSPAMSEIAPDASIPEVGEIDRLPPVAIPIENMLSEEPLEDFLTEAANDNVVEPVAKEAQVTKEPTVEPVVSQKISEKKLLSPLLETPIKAQTPRPKRLVFMKRETPRVEHEAQETNDVESERAPSSENEQPSIRTVEQKTDHALEESQSRGESLPLRRSAGSSSAPLTPDTKVSTGRVRTSVNGIRIRFGQNLAVRAAA